MTAWILALILLCAPADADQARLPEIAAAIDAAAGGDTELAATLVALACRESHFRPDAVSADRAGYAWGTWQIHESNFHRLGISWDDATDPTVAANVAARMVTESARVCRTHPREERLGHYASGGPTCDVPEGLAASRNRMALAKWLLHARPPHVDVLHKSP